ncbi:MAG: DUF1800 domain-containing protein [Akkermansiaceae bacterium]|jgi:uncharacterized protein (DUF1800 family)|nr:DUF1800 domain-containing protein [Akkermansiaceae bacterium]MDP4646917.1 DUF1800 domain-containing protein [Akkermansiaceae bacterium]MDP4722351.1 DUF1800 domain-containing protein [Akkermansiaceae bacterium]MDP4781249.1 DUF1800 domain-containing protein [Akkermansiaceae bacterium]MDP4847875.1 DUF1800 domain-containing protein [Akkermansiaceae bacterium]
MLPKATSEWKRSEARHLLNRAGFGGTPEEVDVFHSLGREKAVDALLDVEGKGEALPLPEWATLEQTIADMQGRLEQRRTIQEKSKGLSAAEAEKLRQTSFQEMQRDNRRRALESQGWWFKRILVTKAPLREKMTLFWHDHFATSILKVKQPVLMMNQNELFRDHAFGNYRELTQKIVRDPAMMLYLDTQMSSKAQPNENFARELMELFTLGEGNYTEEDVREAARAFTGFKLNRLNGTVMQSASAWDDGVKKIFGKSGAFNGADVVNLIFKKDECAEFMVRKLWEFFAYETPEDSVVKSLAPSFRSGGYEVKPLLREMFLSQDFYHERAMGSQVKCPVQYLVQMLKELEVEEPPLGLPIMGQTQLGQVLFMPPNVAGWDWGKAWINTNTLLTRYNIAGSLIKGSGMKMGDGDNRMGAMLERMNRRKTVEGGSSVPDFAKIAPETDRADTEALVDRLIERFFGVPIPDKARKSFIAYADSMKGENFTNETLGELCHLMLSTPYYQLC